MGAKFGMQLLSCKTEPPALSRSVFTLTCVSCEHHRKMEAAAVGSGSPYGWQCPSKEGTNGSLKTAARKLVSPLGHPQPIWVWKVAEYHPNSHCPRQDDLLGARSHNHRLMVVKLPYLTNLWTHCNILMHIILVCEDDVHFKFKDILCTRLAFPWLVFGVVWLLSTATKAPFQGGCYSNIGGKLFWVCLHTDCI